MPTRIRPSWGRVIPVVLAVALVMGGWELTRGNLANWRVASVARQAMNVRLIESPVRFEPNRGQSDPRVKFLAHGSGYSLFLTPREAVLSLHQATQETASLSTRGPAMTRAAIGKPTPGKTNKPADKVAVLRIKLVGANPKPPMEGLDALNGHVNYFIGNDPGKWQRNIPTYAQVAYRGIYPGIDQVYYGGTRDRLEYDFVVAPGANPNDIRMRFEGEDQLRLNRDGDLAIAIGGSEVVQHAPVIYQERDGHRERVTGKCVLRDRDTVGFEVASYDRSRTLIIDPGLLYSTYLGGSVYDIGQGIALDGSGNAIVAGIAESSDFPTTAGAYQTALFGTSNVFVTKFNSTGSALLYSAFFGGHGLSGAAGVALDSSDDAYVVGGTSATDFPITSGAFQTTFVGTASNFVTKLDPSGSTLIYSTFLGGGISDVAYGLAIDSSGDAYVTGLIASTDSFPITPGAFQTTLTGIHNAFVTKLNPSGSGLLYSTYLGGSFADVGFSVAVDNAGDAFVAGTAQSSNFPVTAGSFQTGLHGGSNAFVTKFNPNGTGLLYSTLLGGSQFDSAYSIAIDNSGEAYLTGLTNSTDFPISPGAFQTTLNTVETNGDNAFVTRFNASGSELVYSTFLGGNRFDLGREIVADGSGAAYATGSTSSTTFPTTPGALQTSLGSANGNNAFVTKITPDGSNLAYSTYLGGSGFDGGSALAIDTSGDAYVTGGTGSPNFPVTAGAYQTVLKGNNVFVSKLDLIAGSPTPTPSPSATPTPTITPTPTATPTPAGPAITVRPQLIHFANVTVGSTTFASIAIGNVGGATLVGAVTLPKAPFGISGSSNFNLAPGKHVKITLSFSPTMAGTFHQLDPVTSNTPTGSVHVKLEGTGVMP